MTWERPSPGDGECPLSASWLDASLRWSTPSSPQLLALPLADLFHYSACSAYPRTGLWNAHLQAKPLSWPGFSASRNLVGLKFLLNLEYSQSLLFQADGSFGSITFSKQQAFYLHNLILFTIMYE